MAAAVSGASSFGLKSLSLMHVLCTIFVSLALLPLVSTTSRELPNAEGSRRIETLERVAAAVDSGRTTGSENAAGFPGHDRHRSKAQNEGDKSAELLSLSSRNPLPRKSQHSRRGGRCRRTIQGRWLVADDSGFVCLREDLNSHTGCCPKAGSPHSCRTCSLNSRCCFEFEYCVSCCQNANHTSASIALSTPRAKHASSGTFTSVFDYCQNRCRHNSHSVVHENAYLREDHHCFSQIAISNLDSGSPPNASRISLDDVSVKVGIQGQSCDATCAAEGFQCAEQYLPLLNNCTIMQQYLLCSKGCLPSVGSDQPALVADDAPSNNHPGTCLYTEIPQFSCKGLHAITSRLCPCRAS